MADVPQVTIVNGIPTAGSGTVETLSTTNTVIGAVGETAPASDTASSGLNGRLQRIAQRITSLFAFFGTTADAKSTATDTTAITAMQVWKQISASVQSAVTALGSTALDLGQGTGGTRTLRVAIDGAQLDGSEYETVAASQTAQALGAAGATGDYISKVIIIPATTSPGNVLLLDNATSITIFTGGATSVSNLVPFTVDLGMISVSGAWKITTGSNVSCIGIGNFT